MNRDQWIESAEALLHLDEKKVLVPHGIGGHARTLLEEAVTLLRAHNSDSAEPVAWTVRDAEANSEFEEGYSFEVLTPSGAWKGVIAMDPNDARETIRAEWDKEQERREAYDAPNPLYLASPPSKEVEITDEMVRKAALSIGFNLGFNPREPFIEHVKMALAALEEALTNRTPDDEVGNG